MTSRLALLFTFGLALSVHTWSAKAGESTRPNVLIILANLRDDPGETHNLAGCERKELGKLSRLLQRQVQAAGGVPWQKRP